MDRDDLPEAVAEHLHRRRRESSGVLVRWLRRLGYRAEPSDVDIIVARYATRHEPSQHER